MVAALCWIGSESSSSDPWIVLKRENAWRGSSWSRLLNLSIIYSFESSWQAHFDINISLPDGNVSKNKLFPLNRMHCFKFGHVIGRKLLLESRVIKSSKYFSAVLFVRRVSLLFYYCYTKLIMKKSSDRSKEIFLQTVTLNGTFIRAAGTSIESSFESPSIIFTVGGK